MRHFLEKFISFIRHSFELLFMRGIELSFNVILVVVVAILFMKTVFVVTCLLKLIRTTNSGKYLWSVFFDRAMESYYLIKYVVLFVLALFIVLFTCPGLVPLLISTAQEDSNRFYDLGPRPGPFANPAGLTVEELVSLKRERQAARAWRVGLSITVLALVGMFATIANSFYGISGSSVVTVHPLSTPAAAAITDGVSTTGAEAAVVSTTGAEASGVVELAEAKAAVVPEGVRTDSDVKSKAQLEEAIISFLGETQPAAASAPASVPAILTTKKALVTECGFVEKGVATLETNKEAVTPAVAATSVAEAAVAATPVAEASGVVELAEAKAAVATEAVLEASVPAFTAAEAVVTPRVFSDSAAKALLRYIPKPESQYADGVLAVRGTMICVQLGRIVQQICDEVADVCFKILSNLSSTTPPTIGSLDIGSLRELKPCCNMVDLAIAQRITWRLFVLVLETNNASCSAYDAIAVGFFKRFIDDADIRQEEVESFIRYMIDRFGPDPAAYILTRVDNILTTNGYLPTEYIVRLLNTSYMLIARTGYPGLVKK